MIFCLGIKAQSWILFCFWLMEKGFQISLSLSSQKNVLNNASIGRIRLGKNQFSNRTRNQVFNFSSSLLIYLLMNSFFFFFFKTALFNSNIFLINF